MAQCEAERRKYLSVDVYAGIFNSEFFASSRSRTRGGRSSKLVFDTPSANNKIAQGDSASAEKCDCRSQRLANGYNKPPMLPEKKATAWVQSDKKIGLMKGKLTDVGDGSHAKNISASDLIETEGAKFNAVSGVDRNHNDVNNSADHVDYKLKRMDDNVGPFSHANDGDCSKDNWSSLVTNGDSVTTVNCSSHIELDDCIELQRGSKGGMQSINEEDKLFQSTNSNDKSVYSGKNHKNDESHIQSSNSTWLEEGFSTIGPKLDVNTDQGHFRDNNLTAKDVSNTGLGRSKSFRMQNNAHVVTSMSEIASNRIDRAESGRMQGYGSMRKSQELCGRSGSSILSGEGLAKSNQEKSNFNRQRSLSFSNELLQVQRNTTESETCKDVRNFANDLALKDSPSRVHNRMENLRVRGSTSADSSSSHGGSSHSGSPIAEEYCRDSRTSSFGNILLSKGSPRSYSSRSMGSASISGCGSLVSSKSSFRDSTSTHFCYSTSSGRKSAELVPSRRCSEIMPDRKSSIMVSNGHNVGSFTQRSAEDMNLSYGSINRGTKSKSNGSNISLGSGSLLVGSTNGNVMTVGGAGKSNYKHEDVVDHVKKVDNTLLKKAQASSDPEEVKNAGNEYYRRGHFSEALILYTKAVALRPNSAAYRSNRANALSAVGRLGEAVKECEDAISLDAAYNHAHRCVATLYLRLGLVERAKEHLYAAGQHIDVLEMQRLHTIDQHICRCIEARRQHDWINVIRESDAAVVAGAESALQIFGFKSEALLRLQRLEDADGVCSAAQRIESSLTKAGVLPSDPFLSTIRVQIDMALGRFEGALEAATSAAKMDPCNENISELLRKVQNVCHSRATGNELFRAGRLHEALAIYGEGLESDPFNAVLLCNRAACRSKLGQWEKAIEDCDAALRIQPKYTKALMRRANCLTKLERWEDALQDYEILRRKMPEDLEVARGLFDVHVAMKKLQGEDTSKMRFGSSIEEVLSDKQFQEAIASPGLSVAQFVTKWSERCKQLAPFMDNLCKRNPCVNFLRVDVDENPDLAKFESVNFIPTFKIYKGGQKVKEILGPTEQSLEYALRHYIV